MTIANDDSLRIIDDRLAAMTVRFDERLGAMTVRVDERLAIFNERFERRMADEFGKVRLEINGVRTEMVARRADLLKWAMVFWVSQAAAVASILTVLR